MTPFEESVRRIELPNAGTVGAPHSVGLIKHLPLWLTEVEPDEQALMAVSFDMANPPVRRGLLLVTDRRLVLHRLRRFGKLVSIAVIDRSRIVTQSWMPNPTSVFHLRLTIGVDDASWVMSILAPQPPTLRAVEDALAKSLGPQRAQH